CLSCLLVVITSSCFCTSLLLLLFPSIPHHVHSFFFFNYTATTEIYTLSLHDALPICLIKLKDPSNLLATARDVVENPKKLKFREDRKSTRLNSSHVKISYAVFCLKKKKKTSKTRRETYKTRLKT